MTIDPTIKKSLFIAGLLFVAVGIFYFHPAVEYNRIIIPETVYANQDCDCWCILNSRPWYSRFNYWWWLWLIITPLIVFSVKPDVPKWQRAVRTLTSIGVGYGLANLGLHLNSAIRNGPFVVNNDYPWQRIWDDYGGQCANIGGDASLVFTLYVGGWIYASIYTGWWNIIWAQYHKRKTKLIERHFKRDPVTKIVVFLALLIPLLFMTYVAGWYLLHFFQSD